MSDHSSTADMRLEWLHNLEPMPIPVRRTPFIRTKFLNDKREGCFICGRKSGVTRHHVRRGKKPLCVFLCWKHHQIIHATALERFNTADIRTTLVVADKFKLWKYGEKNVVRKKILTELDRRRLNGNNK